MRPGHDDHPGLTWSVVALLMLVAACSQAAPRIESASSASVLPSTVPAGGKPAASALISVTTDHDRYALGQTIVATIDNGLASSVFAPPSGGCSIVSVSRLDGNRWVSVDSCPTRNVNVTEIASETRLTRPLGPSGQPPTASGPIVIGPVSPAASGDDLTSLPTLVPWRSGDPIRVMPEGAIAAPFSVVGTDLGAGTYRIEFRFAQGSANGPSSTVESAPFRVGG